MSENSRPVPTHRGDGKKVTLADGAVTAGTKGGFTVRKKFGGTETQIRGALTFYKWCAWISGTFLLLLVAEMISRYAFGYDLVAGGTDAQTGQTVALGWLNLETGNLHGGLNISTWILIIHGWFYVIYLISCFRLWLLMRWALPQMIVMALGGVVPFLSFIVERRIYRETLELLAANPQATKRY
ncbi:DUF3817 domain-containing protein [Rothia sp. P100]|uniref:DUF3817 domain-containing protein n=1 Tax=Rothia sp. P100 TaxID=2939578 RepID=UPI00203F9A9A|nr:DUF3817 domain-containing protein [Rothia sp. P100]MCM3509605.1 DUF3817 domain-containing protein [Rothia sp. P100]